VAARIARKSLPKPAPPAPEPAPPEPGTVSLAIAPWGQVMVDGTEVGVSPPLNRLNLAAGSHVVEVHNGASPVFREQIEVEPGKTLFLQHRF
jgi:serine/threonine-protein kinase